MRVAYLTGRYPGVSKTFVQREVAGLRDLGVEVSTFSLWRTPRGELLSGADRREAAATQVLIGRPSRATLASMAAHPRACSLALARAARLAPAGRRAVLGSSWAFEAVRLWSLLRPRGIRHVHAHLAGSAPTVALLTAAIGNAAGDGERWTWSFTVHGFVEFADVWREQLGAKLQAADFVVAVSDFTRSQLMAWVGEQAWPKIHVVRCGVDLGRFAPVTEPRVEGPVELLCVARLHPVKGHAVLLEALRLVAADGLDVRLTVVGDGPARAGLEAQARRLGIAGRVTFRGALSHDEVHRHLAAAHVFCLPSLMEGVPIVLMEAMAMGRPVVASAVAGIPELIDHGREGLLVRPGRVDEVAAALTQLCRDAGLRAELGHAGRRKVEREYDAAASARHMRDLLDHYAGAPVARPA